MDAHVPLRSAPIDPARNSGEPTTRGSSRNRLVRVGARLAAAALLIGAGIVGTALPASAESLVARVTVGTTPYGVAASPDGTRVYVANTGASTLSVIDTVRTSPTYNTVTSTITLPGRPSVLDISADGKRLYASSEINAAVYAINVEVGSAGYGTAVTIPVAASTFEISVSPLGAKLYAAPFNGTAIRVVDIDPASATFNTVVANIPVATNPNVMKFAPDGKRGYVVSRDSGIVSAIDTDPASATYNTIVRAYTGVGVYTTALALNANATIAYVAGFGVNAVRAIDLSTGAITNLITMPSVNWDLLTSNDGNRLYVGSQSRTTIETVDIRTGSATYGTILASTATEATNATLASSPDGTTLYSAQRGNNALAVLAVDSSPVITSGAVPDAVFGVPYSFTFAAVALPAATFALTGDLPDGLTFNAATRTISGTPTESGPFSVTVTATNSLGSDSETYDFDSLEVPVLTSGAPDAGVRGEAYEFTFEASGYRDPEFAVTDGDLPDGLTLTDAGVLAGTPTESGSFPITVEASNPAGADDADYTLEIDEVPVITSAPLPDATVGQAYSFTVSATGKPAPSFTLAGDLPAGLSFDAATAAIAGTPTESGDFTVTLTASNPAGDADEEYTFSSLEASAFTTGAPDSGIVGDAYEFTFEATGYPMPVFALTAGDLPDGLTFGADGVLEGTPTESGTFPITVEAANGVESDTADYDLMIYEVPAITSADPSDGRVGDAYAFTVEATGYPAPTFAAISALPAGVELDTTTGELSGTPEEEGVFSVTIEASNFLDVDSETYEIEITNAPAIVSDEPGTAVVGEPYSFVFEGTGYPAPQFSVTGDLPGGLVFDAASGILSGTPTEAGTFVFTLIASNAEGAVSADYELVVNAVPAITTASLPAATVGEEYEATVEATGSPSAQFTVTAGALPAGLSLAASTGIISGTPTEDGDFSVTIAAANVAGVDNATFTISVEEAAVVDPIDDPTDDPTEEPTDEPTEDAPDSPAVQAADDGLPFTGLDLAAPISAALLLLAAGAIVLARTRRRA